MRLVKLASAAAGACLVLTAIVVTDNAVHLPGRIPPNADAAQRLARGTGSTWKEISVTAADGVALSGWLFTPAEPNSSAVIALHGVGDTRMGMLAHADFLLRSGFIVLVPDVRGHGKSGGAITTYGVREARDVRCWTDWLLRSPGVHRLYGIGQSMGAAILIESLKAEPRFRAIVADCPFATFEEIAYERLHQVSGIPQPLFWPIVHLGFLYADLRYGVDLRQASPLEAIRATRVPVLLIHGTADRNIPPRHSLELHAANPAATRLWLVPGAGHVASFSTDPQNYARNVVSWFENHP